MTVLSIRSQLIGWIDEAVSAGARRFKACQVVGLSMRTLQRWRQGQTVTEDQRPKANKPKTAHQLSVAERDAVIAVCNTPEFASLPPSQIVPKLADQGCYLASESSFYRILRDHEQQQHRGRVRRAERPHRPTTYTAEGPNQVWSWDITWLPSEVKGRFFYLYMIIDLYSRAMGCIGKCMNKNPVNRLQRLSNKPSGAKLAHNNVQYCTVITAVP